ncbi:unnamed protein product, partial [Acanthocheilonema viteae]
MIIEISVCRPECVEREGFIAVRARLKSYAISVGFCSNKTGSSSQSLVTPYICYRNVGVWRPDIH